MTNKKFKLTKDHLKLLSKMYVGWNYCELGAPSIDCKRPYGNSDNVSDIAEILKWKVNKDIDGYIHFTNAQIIKAETLHIETEIALQICLSTQKFKVGTYVKMDQYDSRSWKFLK